MKSQEATTQPRWPTDSGDINVYATRYDEIHDLMSINITVMLAYSIHT